jgi:DNA gyrase subunit A
MARDLRLLPDGGHRKSAAIVGKVLASYHPHGDVACYEAMVRMAQDFSLRYPLVDGQGNFGSVDGDNAAAYRYTEARLRQIAVEVIGEIDEETVDFRDNFDATEREPVVLPSRIPNLLVNGASGIAVGMATSIPPHNLKDTVKALLELLEDPEVSNAKLAGTIKGPDFPTGCLILNTRKELTEIYRTGRGAIRMRGEWRTEETARGKRFIVISSIPYAVNKSQLVEKIATAIIEKKVPQLLDVRDESTSEVRVVLELASGADPEVAMAYLFKHTPIESNFPVNMTALVPCGPATCRPELLSLRDCLQHFLNFREEVVQKKLQYERKKLLERIHILEGLIAIYDALDEALKIVRKSDGRTDAAKKLQARFKLTEIQSFAVVDMRIYQLSKTNIDEIRAELKEKGGRVKEIDIILKSKDKIASIVKKDLELVSETFGDKRFSKLVTEPIEIEFNEEDYVVHEDVYAIVTNDGWIKRIRQNNELESTRLREGDGIRRAHPLSTLDMVAFLTNHGNLYSLKVTDFPSSSGYGDPVQKLLKFKDGERIVESFGMKLTDKAPEAGSPQIGYPYLVKNDDHVLLVSKDGVGFILKLEGLESIKRSGKRAMKLRDGDELGAASLCVPGTDTQVSLFSQKGSGLRIEFKEIPVRDSAAVGVSLLGVREGDRCVAAVCHRGNAALQMLLSTGKTKDISSKEVVEGSRALKGNKVGVRDDIVRVEKAPQQTSLKV